MADALHVTIARDDQTREVIVARNGDELWFDDDRGRRVVLDAGRRTRFTLDPVARTRATTTLYVLAAQRLALAMNWRHVGEVLEAGGERNSGFGAPLVEHGVSFLLPESKTKLRTPSLLQKLFAADDATILVRTEGRGTIAACGARTIATTQGGRSDGAGAALLSAFLAVEVGGHPLWLGHVRKSGIVPEEIELRFLVPEPAPGGTCVVKVREANKPASLDDRGWTDVLDVNGTHAVDVVLRDESFRSQRTDVNARLERSRAWIRQGDVLRGLVTFMEITLETTFPLPADLAAATNRSEDPEVKAFLALLAPVTSEAHARDALRAFAQIKGRLGEHAYILNVFEAPIRLALKEDDAAAALLLEVVQRNPRFTGAFKDLGDVFLRQTPSDPHRAWLCWQRARAIDESLSMLRDITAFERNLERDAPHYFRFS